MKSEQQDFQNEALRNAAAWMLAIISMPRAIARNEARFVQLVGVALPPSAQHAYLQWAKQHHPDVFEDLNRTGGVPEPSYHAWIANLMGVEP